MRAFVLPAIGLSLTALGVLLSIGGQRPIEAQPIHLRESAQSVDRLELAWTSFVYSSRNPDVFDIFGGGCPTPEFLMGRVAVGIHNRDSGQVAEGVRVQLSLRDQSGESIPLGTRIIPQVLAGEERAAVFPVLVRSDRRRIVGAAAEIVDVEAWRAGVPLARPEAQASRPSTLFGDPTPAPFGTPPDPCNRPFSLNSVSCSITNPTERSFVSVTVTIVGFNDGGQLTGFGTSEVPYLAPGSRESCSVTWPGQVRSTEVKVYANFPLNNPPPQEPPSSP